MFLGHTVRKSMTCSQARSLRIESHKERRFMQLLTGPFTVPTAAWLRLMQWSDQEWQSGVGAEATVLVPIPGL